MFLLRAEVFFCSLEILYVGPGIGKFGHLVIKTLDPDLYQLNTDPKH
jgi:hypothetical protein